MVRPPGIEYPGAVYHLTFRDNARNDIHRDDHDRQNYESILSKVVKRDSWHGIHYTTVRRSVRKAKQEM